MKTWADFGIDVPSHAKGEVDSLCPRCSPTRRKKSARCLSVNIDESVWLCHHCGWAGSLKQGEQQSPQRQRWYVKPKVHRLTPLPEKVVVWFAGRGIPDAVLEAHHIGWGEQYFGDLEDRVYAIQFPYYRDRQLVNVKYRTLDKHFRMAQGAERVLYGLDDVSGNKCLIWVEGEIDKLSVEVAGFTACVSVPDGAPDARSRSYESKFDYLETAAELLESIPEHILAVDNDANGQRLEQELARRLGVEKCRHVTWPDGCKDANDVLVKRGSEALAACLVQAKPYPVAGLIETDEVAKDAWQLFERGFPAGESTGWPSLDKLYTVKPGQFTVVVGIPAHGKSTWAQALTLNLAQRADWRIAFYAPEDQPLARLAASLVQRYVGRPIEPHQSAGMTAEEFEHGLNWLQSHCYFLEPHEEQDATLEHILDLARIAVLRYGIKGLVIDPYNEIEHYRPKELTEVEYIACSLRTLRRFGRRYGVHVWLVVHPTKLPRAVDGTYPVPTLYDAAGAAHFRNKCDNGIAIYRSTTVDCDVIEVHVQKIKFREVGKPGMVRLAYHPATGRFSDIGG